MNKERIRLLAGASLIAVSFIFFGIKNEVKVNKALEFKKEDVVEAWTYDNEKTLHDYDYQVSKEYINIISNELRNDKLKRGSIKDKPQNDNNELTILLDGAKTVDLDETSLAYETSIYIKNIDDKHAYVYLEIYNISDDNKVMNSVMERHYTIESKTLVSTINKIYK